MKINEDAINYLKRMREDHLASFFETYDFHPYLAHFISKFYDESIMSDEDFINMFKDLDKFIKNKEFSKKLNKLVKEE